MGDQTAHGGVIILGAPNVLIGEMGSPSPGAGGMGGIMAGLVIAGVDTTSAVASKLSKPGKKSSTDAWRDKHQHAIKQALKDQHKLLAKRKADLAKRDKGTQAETKKYFGSDDEATRKTLATRKN